MFQAKNFLSKKCISLQEGVLCGLSTNVALDLTLKKIVGIVIDNSFVISIKDFFNNDNDALVFKTNANTLPISQCFLPPFYTDVFTTSGLNKGLLTDLLFDERFNVKMFIAEDDEFFAKTIYSSSATAIIIKDGAAPKKITPKPTFVSPPFSPAHLCGNYDFLKGKLCKKTILSRNNELIIKCNSTVKADTLVKAKLNGKLIELSLACR